MNHSVCRGFAAVFGAACLLGQSVASAVTIPVQDDASVNQTASVVNYNYGHRQWIDVDGTASNNMWSYLHFGDVRDYLPSGTVAADISKVFLNVYVSELNGTGTIDLFAVSGSWVEGTHTAGTQAGSLTWNSKPASTGSALNTINVVSGDENEYITVDVTNLVKDWITNPGNNNGLVLKPNGTSIHVLFDSKENIGGGTNGGASHAPYLDVILLPQNANLSAVAAGTWTGANSINTVGTITSGTWNGTNIALANGGTGSTTASGARANLGLTIGTNVQAWDADIDDLADGSLTGSKVGSGISASNITTGSFSLSLLAQDGAVTDQVLKWSGTAWSPANLAGGSSGQFQYNSSGSLAAANVWRDDANSLALRNSSTAQSLYLYKTYTSAFTFERAALRWESDVLTLGPEEYADYTNSAIDIRSRLVRLRVGGDPGGLQAIGLTSVNPIGGGSVDLQFDRSNAVQTASGGNATISGGERNIAAALYSSIGGGSTNVIEEAGTGSTIAGGTLNDITGDAEEGPVAHRSTISGGFQNQIDGMSYAWIPGGAFAKQVAQGTGSWAAGYFTSPGDAQSFEAVLRQTTTSATQNELYTGANSALGGYTLEIPAGTVVTATINVSATTQDCGEVAGFSRQVVIRNDGTGASVVGSPQTIGADQKTSGASSWSISVEASSVTTEHLAVKVTGAASTTIRWVARVSAVMVSFP